MTTRYPGRRRQHRASAAVARTYVALARLDATARGCTCTRSETVVRQLTRDGLPVVELAHDDACPVIAHGTAHSLAVLPQQHGRHHTNPVGGDGLKRQPRPAH